MSDNVSRREMLQYAGGSVGFGFLSNEIGSVSAANSDDPPPGLYKRPYRFLELFVSSDIDREGAETIAADRTLPTFGVEAVGEPTIYLPEDSVAKSSNKRRPLTATHEGIQRPQNGTVEFNSTPVEAHPSGSATTLRSSDPFELGVERVGNGIRVSKNGSSITLDEPSSGRPRKRDAVRESATEGRFRTFHRSDKLNRELEVQVRARYYGKINVVGHESKTILPVNKRTIKLVEKSETVVPSEVRKGSVDSHDVFIFSRGDR